MNISQQITTFIILVLLIILGAFALLHYPKDSRGPALDVSATSTTVTLPLATTTDAVIIESAPGVANMIHVTSPKISEQITSPLTITGEAKGNWFFEASAPVKVTDASGKVLGVSYVQAKADWMTTDFVPFEGQLTFVSAGYGQKGFLILSNDNPSGLPENDRFIKIPVIFK